MVNNAYSASHQRVASTYLYHVSTLFSVLFSLLSSPTFSLLPLSFILTATLFIHLHRYAFHPFSLSTFTMHFSNFLIAATALCATSASADCFGSGYHWGDHPAAKTQLADACTELQGNYEPGEVLSKCRNNPEGGSYNFKIENHTGGSIDISQDECEREIGGQIDNCGHGGEVKRANVWFRYGLYNRSWSTWLLLLTQIGAIRTKGLARHSYTSGGSTHR